jgi:hypothetical protein
VSPFASAGLTVRCGCLANALIGARDVIAEQVKRGYFVLSHWIDVVDEQGEPVVTVTFRDAVDIKE